MREQAPLQDGLCEGSGFGRSGIEKQMGGGGKGRWLENRAKKVDRGAGQTDRLPWRSFGGSDGNDLQCLATWRGRLSGRLRLRRCRARAAIMRRHLFCAMIRDHGQPERAMIGKRQPRERSQHDRDPAKGGRSASLPHEWSFSAGKSLLCQLCRGTGRLTLNGLAAKHPFLYSLRVEMSFDCEVEFRANESPLNDSLLSQ